MRRRVAFGIHRDGDGSQPSLHESATGGHIILDAFCNARFHMSRAEHHPCILMSEQAAFSAGLAFKEEIDLRCANILDAHAGERSIGFVGFHNAHPHAKRLKSRLIDRDQRPFERETGHTLPLLIAPSDRQKVAVNDMLPKVAGIGIGAMSVSSTKTAATASDICPFRTIRSLSSARNSATSLSVMPSTSTHAEATPACADLHSNLAIVAPYSCPVARG
jgi:hypothetical protein